MGGLNVSETILPTQNNFYIWGFMHISTQNAKFEEVCVIIWKLIHNLEW